MQIKIRAQDLSGERMDVTFEGWQARIFQHEFDHLQVGHPASTLLTDARQLPCETCIRSMRNSLRGFSNLAL